MSEFSMLEEALQLVGRGFNVIPLHTPTDRTDRPCSCNRTDCSSAGKHPRTKNGSKDASADPEQIRSWWSMWPNANIGIVTGDGLVVIDVDQPTKFPQHLVEGTPTLEVKTSKGYHLYYKGNAQNTQSPCPTLTEYGYEVRGTGGLVVAPPSLHASGHRYEWTTDVARADLPAVPALPLYEASERVSSARSATPFAEGDTFPKGTRNVRLTSIAGGMRRQGMGADAIFDALKSVNAAQCDPPLLEPELRTIAKSNARYEPAPSMPRKGDDGRPEIKLNNNEYDDLVAQTVQALQLANEPPVLFSSDGRIVVEQDGSLVPLRVPGLRVHMSRAASFVNVKVAEDDEGNKATKKKKEWPPAAIAESVLESAGYEFPPVDRIATAPFYTPDFTLVTEPGYNASARVIYRPTAKLPIRVMDYKEALTLITDELLVDFPFEAEADKANAIALMILPFVRSAIARATPMHLLDASTHGAGKGLLGQVLLGPTFGDSVASVPFANEEAERRKMLTSKLAAGASLILYDNVDITLKSAALEQAITASVYEDRYLAQNRVASLPVRCVWAATANNAQLGPDMARRCVRIRLTPPYEDPSARSVFTHPLPKWADDNRAELVSAVIALVEHWKAEGMPRGTERMGSFEEWAAIMGGILSAIGVAGFLANRRDLMQGSDSESEEWFEFFADWHGIAGDDAVTTKQIAEWQRRGEGPRFPASVTAKMVMGAMMPVPDATNLGKELAKKRDRVFGARQLVRSEGTSRGARKWRLVTITDEAITQEAQAVTEEVAA